MASDENEETGLELEDEGHSGPSASGDPITPKKEAEVSSAEDAIDVTPESVEPVVEPETHAEPESLSAVSELDETGDFGADIDVDITGDPDVDFADEIGEDMSFDDTGSSGMKKFALPALVVLVAAGVGGYILMNPQILSTGNSGAPVQQESSAYVAEQTAMVSPQDITESAPSESAPVEVQTDPFSNAPPQPTVNQNTVPSEPPVMDQPEMQAIAEPAEELELADAQVSAEEESDQLSEDLFALKFPGEEEALVDTEATEDVPLDLSIETPEEQGSADVMEEKVVEEIKEEAKEEVIEVVDAELPAMPEPIADIEPAAEEVVAESEPQQTEPEVSAPLTPEPAPEVVAPAQAQGTQSPDIYFDGRIPTGPLATEIGPRKVDPTLEPASQFVVVKKAHEAKSPESLLVSANRALKLKRYDAALDMFDQLYNKNPRDPRILMGRAVAQQNAGLSESAIKSYEELLAIRPNDADAMLNMLGIIRTQYPSVALRRLMDLHSRYPSNAGIAAQVGVTQADLGHYDDAVRFLGIAMSLEPENAQHAYNMAIIADRNGDTKNAISHYEKALEMDAVFSSGRSIPRETVYDRLAVLRRR